MGNTGVERVANQSWRNSAFAKCASDPAMESKCPNVCKLAGRTVPSCTTALSSAMSCGMLQKYTFGYHRTALTSKHLSHKNNGDKFTDHLWIDITNGTEMFIWQGAKNFYLEKADGSSRSGPYNVLCSNENDGGEFFIQSTSFTAETYGVGDYLLSSTAPAFSRASSFVGNENFWFDREGPGLTGQSDYSKRHCIMASPSVDSNSQRSVDFKAAHRFCRDRRARLCLASEVTAHVLAGGSVFKNQLGLPFWTQTSTKVAGGTECEANEVYTVQVDDDSTSTSYKQTYTCVDRTTGSAREGLCCGDDTTFIVT